QPSGAYHYHGLPEGLIQKLGRKKMLLVCFAADGFPIYTQYGPRKSGADLQEMRSSYRVKNGTRPGGPGGSYDGTFEEDYEYFPGAGDLDECNRVFGATPEYPEGIYHYHLTNDYPFVPRFFRGTPDESFRHAGGPGAGRGAEGQGPGGD